MFRQKLSDMVVQTLLAIRKEDAFDLFRLIVLRSAQFFYLEPQLPRNRRNRRRPKRYEEGEADGEFHNDPKGLLQTVLL